MDRWMKAIVRLNFLTQEGKLKWHLIDPPDLRGTSDHVEVAFGTTFEGESLRIFRRRHTVATDVDQYGWQSTPELQIIDAEGRTLFTFPFMTALVDLYETVQYQTSGVGSLLDKLAGDA